MGHDHQELLEADLLHRSGGVLVEVPAETGGGGGVAAERRRGKGWTSPSVKECLDDLGADGVAGQIRDRREVLPPEGIKGHFCKEWLMVVRQ